MNRYPLWLNLFIAGILLAGFIYALPNFFGESPAVQISAGKATAKVDEALEKRSAEALKTAKIVYDEVFVEPNGVKFRFKDTDTQLRAKDVLSHELGENYVVALNLLSNSPR